MINVRSLLSYFESPNEYCKGMMKRLLRKKHIRKMNRIENRYV